MPQCNTNMDEWQTIFLPETTSTNVYLKELLPTGQLAEGTLAYTDFQAQGKGQRGNKWLSEPGANLLMSVVLFPRHIEAHRQFLLSAMVALAIKRVLDAYTSDIAVKWPNDIYWKNQKLAGILIEHDLEGRYLSNTIVGIGLNVNQHEFAPELPNPVSLCQIVGHEVDKMHLLTEIHQSIRTHYADIALHPDNIMGAYQRSLYRADGYHPFVDANGQFRAKIVGVEPMGYLVLADEQTGAHRKYAFKEVQYVI